MFLFAILFLPLGIESQSVTAPPIEASQVQQVCPITGDPINRDLYVDTLGKRIYVCDEASKAEVEKNPEKILIQLQQQGIVLESVKKPQTKCPVDGHDIDPNLFVEADGKRIFVCSEGCQKRTQALRVKYLRQMENLGVEVHQTARK